MEYHIIKRFKYTSGDSMYSHIRTEKSLETRPAPPSLNHKTL
jgi:hypothetical protein